MTTSPSTVICTDHDGLAFIYVCETCSQKLICKRCEKTEHRGHKLGTIKTVAKAMREKLPDELLTTTKRIEEITEILKEQDILKNTQQQSFVQCRIRLRYLKKTIHNVSTKCWETQMENLHTFQEQPLQTQRSKDIEFLNSLLHHLDEKKDCIQKLMTDREEDITVIYKYNVMNSEFPYDESYVHKISKINTLTFVPVLIDDLSVKKIIVGPKAAQTVSVNRRRLQTQHSTKLVFVNMLKVEKPHTPIIALYVADDNKCFVAFWEQFSCSPSRKSVTRTGSITVCLSDGEEHLWEKENIDIIHPVFFTGAPQNRVRLFCSQNAKKRIDIFDLGTLFPQQRRNCNPVYYAKAGKIKMGAYKIYRVSDEDESKDTFLYCVRLNNPQRIVADRSEKYFAIMDESKVVKKPTSSNSYHTLPVIQRQLQMFKPSAQGEPSPSLEKIGDVKGDSKGAIQDMCFYSHPEHGVVLLIAMKNKITVAEPNGEGIEDIYLDDSVSDCLPFKPTALTIDRHERLWVGCKGGQVLCLLTMDEILESNYDKPLKSAGNCTQKEEDESPDEEGENDYIPVRSDARAHASSMKTWLTPVNPSVHSFIAPPLAEEHSHSLTVIDKTKTKIRKLTWKDDRAPRPALSPDLYTPLPPQPFPPHERLNSVPPSPCSLTTLPPNTEGNLEAACYQEAVSIETSKTATEEILQKEKNKVAGKGDVVMMSAKQSLKSRIRPIIVEDSKSEIKPRVEVIDQIKSEMEMIVKAQAQNTSTAVQCLASRPHVAETQFSPGSPNLHVPSQESAASALGSSEIVRSRDQTPPIYQENRRAVRDHLSTKNVKQLINFFNTQSTHD